MVVIKNLKALLYDNDLSPIWMIPESEPPDLCTYCAKIGSSEASNSFCTFSSRTHLPYCTANSNVLIKVSPTLTTSIPSGCYFDKFLINLLAWFCGSIIKGHLLVLSMMIPFSVELSSFGNSAMFHVWILTGSPKYCLIKMPSVWGRPTSFIFCSHYCYILSRYVLVKGPT